MKRLLIILALFIAAPVYAQQNIHVPGTIASGSDNVMVESLDGIGTVSVEISGTYDANLEFQVSNSGTAWVTVYPQDVSQATLVGAVNGTTGLYRYNVGGIKKFRVHPNPYTSGTATVVIEGSHVTATDLLSGTRASNGSNVNISNVLEMIVRDSGGASGDARVLDVDPASNDLGLVVRAIPSATAQPVSGPVTNTQMRASPVPVSGPVTDTQLRASAIPVSGPLTDTQLRLTPLPVSGIIATGGLTDTQLRLTPVPVSGTVTANAGTNLNTSALFLDATYTGRMPAGASPANGESNTNTALSRIGGYNYIFNGASWDRWTGAVTGTVTANAGTNLNTSALALSATQTDRTQKSQITDGTRDGTVKAASTAAAAADTSVVVGLSPNSPLPAGSNAIGTVTANAGTNLNTSALALDATITGRFMAAITPTESSANPTTTGTVAWAMLYNNSSWDREHGNWYLTSGDTGTKIATFNGITQTNYDSRGAMIVIQLGTVSGTTPTLSAQLQISYDNGTTFINIGPALANLTTTNQTGMFYVYPSNTSQAAGVTPANLTNGATVSNILNFQLSRKWRLVYTIAGTTPSFAITNVHVNYLR